MTLSSSRTSPNLPRGRAYCPYEHADRLGLEVVVRPLRTGHELWLPEYNTLVINARLRSLHQRNAAAHGVGHAALGHEDDRPKHEKKADQFAAWNLIDPDELADLRKWAPDEQRLVQELGVTTRLFRAYVLSSAA
ncbi:ImmA/IrrE family metallo-endopeptidase [Microbacterium sp. KNMS]